jgi:hypothetical protein
MAFTGPETAGPGRPKGGQNKTTIEVRAAARTIVDNPNYRAALALRVKSGTAPHMETLLWHYAYGKPVEKIEVKDTTDEFENITAEQLRERAKLIAQRIVEPEQPERQDVH